MQMVPPAAKRCLTYQPLSSRTTMLNRLRKKKLLKNISRAGEAGSSRQYYQTEAQTSMILKVFPLLVRVHSQSELWK